jgi:hypothetical protein
LKLPPIDNLLLVTNKKKVKKPYPNRKCFDGFFYFVLPIMKPSLVHKMTKSNSAMPAVYLKTTLIKATAPSTSNEPRSTCLHIRARAALPTCATTTTTTRRHASVCQVHPTLPPQTSLCSTTTTTTTRTPIRRPPWHRAVCAKLAALPPSRRQLRSNAASSNMTRTSPIWS